MLMDTIFVKNSLDEVERAINEWNTMIKASEGQFDWLNLEPFSDYSTPNCRAWGVWDCAIIAIRRASNTELDLIDVKKDPLDSLAIESWNRIGARFDQADQLTKRFYPLREGELKVRLQTKDDYWFLYRGRPELGDKQKFIDELGAAMQRSSVYARDEQGNILYFDVTLEREWEEHERWVLQRQKEWDELQIIQNMTTKEATLPYLPTAELKRILGDKAKIDVPAAKPQEPLTVTNGDKGVNNLPPIT